MSPSGIPYTSFPGFKIDGIVWKYRVLTVLLSIPEYSFKIDGIVWKSFSESLARKILSSFKIDGIVWK